MTVSTTCSAGAHKRHIQNRINTKEDNPDTYIHTATLTQTYNTHTRTHTHIQAHTMVHKHCHTAIPSHIHPTHTHLRTITEVSITEGVAGQHNDVGACGLIGGVQTLRMEGGDG